MLLRGLKCYSQCRRSFSIIHVCGDGVKERIKLNTLILNFNTAQIIFKTFRVLIYSRVVEFNFWELYFKVGLVFLLFKLD